MKNVSIHTGVFAPVGGGCAEYHVQITVSDPSLPFEGQLEALLQAMREVSSGRTVHFRRFFLSDAANQAPRLMEALQELPSVPTSIVQQAPLDGTRIAMWMYCTSLMECPGGVPAHNGYSHLWAGSLVSPGPDSRSQTGGIFISLEERLARRGLHVSADTVRTWIFVRDVDVNYAGVVAGRREFFAGIGLTPQTHFIASTGIGGRHPDSRCTVMADAYSIGGLDWGQLSYLYALDHLSPTAVYGVTFERGAAVTYGDRRHLFISGTASIDEKGRVMYPGDARAQAGRMLDNVAALLSEGGASPEDIVMAVVYLRDPADYALVRSVLVRRCPGLHAIYVHGPVCRPAWLVEMECIAVTPAGNAAFRAF